MSSARAQGFALRRSGWIGVRCRPSPSRSRVLPAIIASTVPCSGWRYVVTRAAVDRGSVDHDAFGVGVEVHARINQAEAPELRRCEGRREGTYRRRPQPVW